MAWTIKELAEAGGGRAANKASAKVENFRSADEAGPGDLTFVTDGKWLARLKDGAAAVIPPGMETEAGDRPLIVADSPRLAFAKILAAVKPEKRPQPGIDSKAAVMNSAVIGKDVYVGPMAYVGKKAEIGDHTILHHGAHVSEGARVGENCLLYPHSYVGPGSILGDRVILGPGSSIGYDGFGYQWDGERHVKIPQVGIAVIENDVEIGALSTVDRAMLGETRIGKGTKIDNLVIVAHNCNIGENVILAGQVGLAGSVTLDDGVILGGQAGVADGRHLGEGVVAAGRSGIAKDIPPGEKIAGAPTMPVAAWLRTGLVLEKLPSLFKRMKKLEKRIKELEDEK